MFEYYIEDGTYTKEQLKEEFFEILCAEDEYEVIDSVRNYHGNIELDYCDIPSGKIATWNYIWCCYAIQWGINQYNWIGKK